MSDSFQKKLENSRVLIYGVNENEGIKTRIAPVFTPERLTNGITMYESALAAFNSQKLEKKEASQATRSYNEVYDAIDAKLVKIRKAGRYFFKSDTVRNDLLQLDEAIPTNFAEWIIFTEATVDAIAADATIQEKFTLVGITPEEITAIKDQLSQVQTLKLTAEKEDGEAQVATVLKKETMDELTAYCSELRACLDLFYEGSERQILEEVGILVR